MTYDYKLAKKNIAIVLAFLMLLTLFMGSNPPVKTVNASINSITPTCSRTHKIVKGNTVWGISRTYSVSMSSIVNCNNWQDGINHLILPGQTILIPTANVVVSQPITVSQLATPQPAMLPAPPPYFYVHPNPMVERWHSTAIAAGWSEQDWRSISCIMQHPVHTNVAESSGIPDLHVKRGADNSYGLMMLNTRGSLWKWYSLHVSTRDALLDPYTNLHVAKLLSDYVGSASWSHHDRWSPWRSTKIRGTCF